MTRRLRPPRPRDPPIPRARWDRELAALSPTLPDAEELQRRIDRADPGTGLTRKRRR